MLLDSPREDDVIMSSHAHSLLTHASGGLPKGWMIHNVQGHAATYTAISNSICFRIKCNQTTYQLRIAAVDVQTHATLPLLSSSSQSAPRYTPTPPGPSPSIHHRSSRKRYKSTYVFCMFRQPRRWPSNRHLFSVVRNWRRDELDLPCPRML